MKTQSLRQPQKESPYPLETFLLYIVYVARMMKSGPSLRNNCSWHFKLIMRALQAAHPQSAMPCQCPITPLTSMSVCCGVGEGIIHWAIGIVFTLALFEPPNINETDYQALPGYYEDLGCLASINPLPFSVCSFYLEILSSVS